MDLLNEWISSINDVLWSYILVTLLLGCAFWFTIRSRFVQFRMMGEMVRLLGDSPKKAGSHEKHISSFQAFAVSLASRVGTGNLAGVATAITVGGPGAVFWMWLIALLGSSSAFVESTLAQLYKRKGKDSFVGGPAYYMEKGLKARWMGILFAILISITFGFAFNSVQSNTICAAWEKAFGIDHVWMGIVLTAVTLRYPPDCPGERRDRSGHGAGLYRPGIGRRLVQPRETTGCDPPDRIECLRLGAGLGRRHRGNADAGHQTGPDTLIICTCTAFIILFSGVSTQTSLNGIQLTQEALTAEVGSAGGIFIALAILLFAFSSIIGNYYYGEANILFITRRKPVLVAYRLLVSAMVLCGSLMNLDLAWSLADIMMGLMTICNLIAIAILSRQAFLLLDHYLAQKRKGISSPVFRKEDIPELEEEAECW